VIDFETLRALLSHSLEMSRRLGLETDGRHPPG
jgi:hypothetical protein